MPADIELERKWEQLNPRLKVLVIQPNCKSCDKCGQLMKASDVECKRCARCRQ